MTDAEQQEVVARLGRLERSNWRWRALASVLGVILLLLLSLGMVSAVAVRTEAVRQRLQAAEADRRAVEAERRAKMAAEEVAAQRWAEEMRLAGAERRAAETRQRAGQARKGGQREVRPQRPEQESGKGQDP
jgi:hypothetical protein